MAGLSFITSHTKAYAEKLDCGSGSVVVVRGVVVYEPIVCDGGGKRTLNSISGREIKINMDMGGGSKEAAVTVTGQGTNITIMKKLKVTGSKGSGLPVIKVEKGGKLTLNEEVDVKGATIKKEIVVDGAGSSVTLKGVLKGFERGEVKVSNEGMVVLGKGVEGIEEVKVKINDGGTVRLMRNMTFNNGTEAGIKIEGSGGNASVIGVGSGKTVTMTVKGTRADGIQMDGTGKASVVMLKIVGTGSGKGVDMQNETGTMTLNMVNVSGFRVGVNAKSGKVNINGDSTITVANSGTGIMVSGSGATVKM
ncbi:hypothetical protein, partial [Bartonella bovis]|uniref:hypothetical protein n=1 Tax=Bartonella bovis TaxID=155194 RepID=UPI0011AF4C79